MEEKIIRLDAPRDLLLELAIVMFRTRAEAQPIRTQPVWLYLNGCQYHEHEGEDRKGKGPAGEDDHNPESRG